MPGADEQEEELQDPELGDEDRDQRVELAHPEPERPEDEPELAPLDEEVGEDIEPIAPEAKMRRDLRAEAKSLRHLLTHLPKNPYCVHCQQAKNETAIFTQRSIQEGDRPVRRNCYLRSCGGTRNAHARVGRREIWLISERPIHWDDSHLPNYPT